MDRIQIINSLISKHNYKSYLEIGVRNPDDCFNNIKCELKHGVDPGVEGEFPVTFRMTSDEFFATNNLYYDIIFIDGLHIDEQVERDILNSLVLLPPNGTIVLHDCNPPNIYYARENFHDVVSYDWGWNGTVWKSIVRVRETIKNIYTSVVDTDWGVGIIQKSVNPNPILNDNIYYSFNKFQEKKEFYLNLISVDDFKKKYL